MTGDVAEEAVAVEEVEEEEEVTEMDIGAAEEMVMTGAKEADMAVAGGETTMTTAASRKPESDDDSRLDVKQ